MLDSDRLTKGPLDYQVVVAYTGLNGAVMRVGDKISLDENLGSLLCRKGYLKDITARVADTLTERVEDLEGDVSFALNVIDDNNLTTSD